VPAISARRSARRPNLVLRVVVIALALAGLVVLAIACGKFWWVPVVLVGQCVGLFFVFKAMADKTFNSPNPKRALDS